MQEDSETVSLPPELYRRIEDRLTRTRYTSVEEYVVEVVDIAVTNAEDASTDEDAVMRDRVEDRLRSLGYLDESGSE